MPTRIPEIRDEAEAVVREVLESPVANESIQEIAFVIVEMLNRRGLI